MPRSLAMATTMTIGMAAWMALRRHSWIGIAEMGAAMFWRRDEYTRSHRDHRAG